MTVTTFVRESQLKSHLTENLFMKKKKNRKKGPTPATPASPQFKIHEILPYEYVILLDVQNTCGNRNVTAESLAAHTT